MDELNRRIPAKGSGPLQSGTTPASMEALVGALSGIHARLEVLPQLAQQMTELGATVERLSREMASIDEIMRGDRKGGKRGIFVRVEDAEETLAEVEEKVAQLTATCSHQEKVNAEQGATIAALDVRLKSAEDALAASREKKGDRVWAMVMLIAGGVLSLGNALVLVFVK